MQTFHTYTKEETVSLARELCQTFGPGLVTLAGNLGAGKTAFSGGVLGALGAEVPYQSPTFVLMIQYDLPKKINGIARVYHTDAYRLEAKDFRELGFEEWCADPEGLVLLEWPERIAELLPTKRTEIHIEQISETERQITRDEKH